MWTVVILAARVTLVLMLVPAVNAKLWQTRRVSSAIGKWKLVPGQLALPLAWAVVLAELIVLLTLSAGIGLRFGAVVAVLLFGAIAVGAESVVLRRIATACGCFSLEGMEKVSHITVIRAAAIASLAGLVAYASDWSVRPSPVWSPIVIVLTIPLWLALIRRTVGRWNPLPVRSSP